MDFIFLDDLLDDWFQILEYSENFDGGQEGIQVVFFVEIYQSRVREGFGL